MFAGGAVERMAIFALNIMPYISASIIMQLMTTVSPTLEQLKKEGEQGRKVINQYTRYLTVRPGIFQSYGIAVGLREPGNIVTDPGWFFRLSTVITLTGGTMFLMWLGEQITARGIGNGISLIIFAGIVAELPSASPERSNSAVRAHCRPASFSRIIVMAIAVIAFIVFMERAQRRLLIQYPKRQVGNQMFQGETSHLPLKLNTAGVIPPIFASSLLLLPITVANFSGGQGPDWLTTMTAYARPRPAAVHVPLYRHDHLLRLLLHGDRVQSEGHGRQSEEAWRLHSGHPPGRAHGGIHRLCADAHYGRRRALSGAGLCCCRSS
jgi:preprotein translocase subunit SecY